MALAMNLAINHLYEVTHREIRATLVKDRANFTRKLIPIVFDDYFCN
jgi:hypothetical protein